MKATVSFGLLLLLSTGAAAFSLTVDSCSQSTGGYGLTFGNPDSPVALCGVEMVFHGFGPRPTPRATSCANPSGWSCSLQPNGGVRYTSTSACIARGNLLHGFVLVVQDVFGSCLDTTVRFIGPAGETLSSRQVCLICGPVSDVPEIPAVAPEIWGRIKTWYRE